MTRPAGLRMVLVVVCLCVIGGLLITQGKDTTGGRPLERVFFCPSGFKYDVHVSSVAFGDVEIEECVTPGAVVDGYSYRVTNNSGVALCEFWLPDNTGQMSSFGTNLVNWICTSTLNPRGWRWTATVWSAGIASGSYGDFWIDVPAATTVDAVSTGYVAACNQSNYGVKTTAPSGIGPNLIISGVEVDMDNIGSCDCHEGGQCTIIVKAKVTNIGNQNSDACSAELTDVAGSFCVPLGPPLLASVVGLGVNATTIVTWTWTIPQAGFGMPCLFECHLNVEVNPTPHVAYEYDYNDNFSEAYTCCNYPRADLAIISSSGTCTCVQDPLMSTCTITVNAVVKNVGTADSYPCEATIVDSNGNSHLSSGGIGSLTPNQPQTVSWSWTFGCDKLCPCVTLNPGTLTMTINSNFTGGESNYFNNSVVMVVCCH